jgi:hypothetical protein
MLQPSANLLDKFDVADHYANAMDFVVGISAAMPIDFLPISIYSEFRKRLETHPTIIFRATPSYRSTDEWTDWAYVQFSNGDDIQATTVDNDQTFSREEKYVTKTRLQRFNDSYMSTTRPTELFGFFKVPPHTTDIIINDNISIPANEEESSWCIGRSLKLNPIMDGGLQHPSSTIQYWSKYSRDYMIFPCTKIIAPCLVIPDLDVDKTNKLFRTKNVTVIGTRSLWSKAFVQLAYDLEQKELSNLEDREDVQLI